MKFEEIFAEEGLYVADGFTKGVAIEIRKNFITDAREMRFVEFEEQAHLNTSTLEIPVYEGLFLKDYRKVDSVAELFESKEVENENS